MISVYNKEQFADLLCKPDDDHVPAIKFWEKTVCALSKMLEYYGEERVIEKIKHCAGAYYDTLYLSLGQNCISLYVVPNVENDEVDKQGKQGINGSFDISDEKYLLLTAYKDHIDIFDYKGKYSPNWYGALNVYILSAMNKLSSFDLMEKVKCLAIKDSFVS